MAGYYDRRDFFETYMRMPRSGGLEFAGEWHQLKEMFPDVREKKVLDLGCGIGWHCRYASEQGAKSVLGIDLSENMIARAKEINGADNIRYEVCGLEAFEYPEDEYDAVISNLVLHYAEDLESIYKKVYRTLKRDGVFLFNIEHPTFTAGVRQEWVRDENGRALYWPVDGYYTSGIRKTDFLGFEIEKYHHTLTEILDPLPRIGLELTGIREAMPPESMRDLPEMRDEMRRPMMLLVKTRKRA